MKYDFNRMRFNPEPFRSAQGKVPSNWGSAFKWHETPQGSRFWIEQNAALTDAGRVALDEMLSEFEALEVSV